MKGELHLPTPVSMDAVQKRDHMPDHILHLRNIDMAHAFSEDGSSLVLIVLDAKEGSYGMSISPDDFHRFADMVDQIRESLH